MRKLIGSTVLAAALLTTPLLATAQRRTAAPAGGPKHEMGVDLAAYYTKPSGGSGGIQIGLPVDVRVAFLTRSNSKLIWEPRVSFDLNSIGTTTYVFAPGLNVLHQLKRGSGTRGLLRAPYVTGGAQLTFFDTGPTSGSQFSLGGGVGTRAPFQSAAFRYEGFFAYTFKGGGQPSNFAIGTRLGLSFWH